MYQLVILSLAMLMAVAASAQTPDRSPHLPPPQQNQPQGATANPAPPSNSAHQMQLDLDQMESLVNNMTAQVNFIRDTNMSILLQTNVRLWSVLIRDLRMQLQEQERHAAAPANANSPQRH